VTKNSFLSKSVSSFKGRGGQRKTTKEENKVGRESYNSYISELKMLKKQNLKNIVFDKLIIKSGTNSIIIKNDNILWNIADAIADIVNESLSNSEQLSEVAKNMPATDAGLWPQYILSYIKPIFLLLKEITPVKFTAIDITVNFCLSITLDFFTYFTETPARYLRDKFK